MTWPPLAVADFDIGESLCRCHSLTPRTGHQVAIGQRCGDEAVLVVELAEFCLEASKPSLVSGSGVVSHQSGKTLTPERPQMRSTVERMESSDRQIR